ncbi:monooxygenase, flavin-binding family [Mycolicibacterium fortuitum]|uniref:Monooxygenase, flavin-binding family n=1 Tax=Mycolicibacterium fortuitum TaxID=1766 RepID=A0A0N9XZK7_MYCFO|nr:NAD(P)/FAD-dependent oxidoreductase [Mycolicibacterium fortuitum]ALI25857.1 monooxygenase, flavin-binding family [Mycolicibacterium fortuitum]
MNPLSAPNTDMDVDVLIVGAGISGLGAAYYVQRDLPGKTYAIVEARDDVGGTWDLHRYPGIRSDSDLFTFGYEFKPWKGDTIATADVIRAYLREMAVENHIDQRIRFQTKVIAAAWDSDEARWTVEVEDTRSGQRSRIRCSWVFAATGYYRYDQGYTPEFPGREAFEQAGGQVVHPQLWPEGLDYVGKKVVVIGSGATAVTLVPAMAGVAGHVTMLQRSPTYVIPLPTKDVIADVVRKALPERRAHAILRWKNMYLNRAVWRLSQRFPDVARSIIRYVNARRLPPGYPVDEHFNPRYNPWDQRLCVVPDGDLFAAISNGTASVVTDTIETFTSTGILLTSGKHLEADLVVTATGLNLQAFGGVELTVDGQPIEYNETVAFKGMMLTGVPNFALSIGYTNSSWTLKVGLLCEHFARLVSHMDAHGYDTCAPAAPPNVETRPLLDFEAGYVLRALDRLPKQGPGFPWLTSRDYLADVKLLRHGPVADPNLRFATKARRPAQVPSA